MQTWVRNANLLLSIYVIWEFWLFSIHAITIILLAAFKVAHGGLLWNGFLRSLFILYRKLNFFLCKMCLQTVKDVTLGIHAVTHQGKQCTMLSWDSNVRKLKLGWHLSTRKILTLNIWLQDIINPGSQCSEFVKSIAKCL